MKKVAVIFLILFFFATGVYLQYTKPLWLTSTEEKLWANTPLKGISNLQQIVNKYKNPGKIQNSRIVQQKTFSYNVYTGMHITFYYPTTIKLKQITPQLISLSDPSSKDTNSILYIYSTIVPANIINFKIPFTIPGTLKHSNIIKTKEFTANQETYGNGVNTVNLLVLRKNNNTIVLRIPQDSKPLDEAITEIVNTIKTLH